MGLKSMAILLTCHNRKSHTLKCLESIQNQIGTNQNFTTKVFLVDDGSIDGTSTEVKIQFPSVNIIKGSGSLFWNKGMYLAWNVASKFDEFDYYVWLNDDTILFEDSFIKLLNICIEKGGNSIIAGSFKSEINDKWTYGGYKILSGISTSPVIPDLKNSDSCIKCDIINGNCVIIPRNIFVNVGNLDSTFTHSLGDYDYGLRVAKKGYYVFTTNSYIGTCEQNLTKPNWVNPDLKLKLRIKDLYSIKNSNHPINYFIYINRHFGLFRAFQLFIQIHLRLIFPKVWDKYFAKKNYLS